MYEGILRHYLLRVVALLFFFLVSTSPTLAVDTTVSTPTDTLSPESFTLDVTVDGAGAGTNYLKIDVFQEGSTSYFGATYNGTSWQESGPHTSYLPIQIGDSRQWSGPVMGKVEIGQISSDTTYKIRIRRYTASGAYNAEEANRSAITVRFTSTPSTNGSITPVATTTTTPPTVNQNENTHVPSPPSAIFLSEVMVNPAVGEKEWVELYNDSSSAVELSGWYIDDVEDGGVKPKPFNLSLGARQYGVVEMTSSIFNNDGDSVRILNASGALVSEFVYEDSEKNLTYGTVTPTSKEFCLQLPTRGEVNGGCVKDEVKPSTTEQSDPPTTTQTTSQFVTENEEPPAITEDQFISGKIQIIQVPSTTKSQPPQATIAGVFTEALFLTDNPARATEWIKSLSTSAAGISLVNIFYIAMKIRRSSRTLFVSRAQ